MSTKYKTIVKFCKIKTKLEVSTFLSAWKSLETAPMCFCKSQCFLFCSQLLDSFAITIVSFLIKRHLNTKLPSTQLQAQSQNKTKAMTSKFLVQVDGDVVELDPTEDSQVVLGVNQPTDYAIRMKVYPRPECLEGTRDLGSQETQDQEVSSNVAHCNSVLAATRKRKHSPEAN